MKTFINNSGKEIFNLDKEGNLSIAGNINIGAGKTIYADSISIKNFQDNIKIVRNPEDMDSLLDSDIYHVIYYLGDTSGNLTYGSWWEKVVHSFVLTIDNTPDIDEQFTISKPVFPVTNSQYTYIKHTLESYPNTRVITLTPLQLEDSSIWEIKYCTDDLDVIFTDTVNQDSLEGSNYDLPFSPKNASEYQDSGTYITISVSPNYTVKPIESKDINDYMPLSGGVFSGTISTQDINPSLDGAYSIGNDTAKYNNGYFYNVSTDSLNTTNLEAGNINADILNIKSEVYNPRSGDNILVYSQDGVKKSKLTFIKNSGNSFLRQDGTFAIPGVKVSVYDLFDIYNRVRLKLSESIWRYSEESYMPKGLYETYYDTDYYQILIQDVPISKVCNFGIVPKNSINTDNILLSKFLDLVSTESTNTVVLECSYTQNDFQVYKVNGTSTIYEDSVFNDSIENILKTLSTTCMLYEPDITYAEEGEVKKCKIIITNHISKPVNVIDYDGVSTDMYLSKAGTWEMMPSQSNSAAANTIKGKIVIKEDGTAQVSYISNVQKSGVYTILDTNYEYPVGTLIVQNSSDYIIQTIYNIKLPFYKDTPFIIPNKLTRQGKLYTNYVRWEDWEYEYPNNDYIWKIHPKKSWRSLSYEELNYLLFLRPNADVKKGYIKVNDSLVYVILKDSDSRYPESTEYSLVSAGNAVASVNSITKEQWEEYYKGSAVFPCEIGQNTTALYGGFYSLDTENISVLEVGYNSEGILLENILFDFKQSAPCLNMLVKDLTYISMTDFSISESSQVKFASGYLQVIYNGNLIYRFALNPFKVTTTHNKWNYDMGSYVDADDFSFDNTIYEATSKNITILTED